MKRSFLTVTILLIALAQLSWAIVPRTITYQGVLRDSNGDLVATNNYEMIFRLFTTETGGIENWSEEHSQGNGNAVWVEDGIFSVELGINPTFYGGDAAPFDLPYWLQIEVWTGSAWETQQPRTKLTAVPYAVASASVYGSWNELESRGRLGINVAGTADITKAVVLTDLGTVGIGTMTPEYPLHVYSDTSTLALLSGGGGTYNYAGLWLESATDKKSWGLLHRSITSRQNNFTIQQFDGINRYNRFSIRSDGRVGIGTTLPMFSLDVVGTVKADTLMLATPIERWYSIPHMDFDSPNNPVRTDFATYSDAANQYVTFMAPVHLPHGALVTQFQATVGDTAQGNMVMELRAYTDNGMWWQIGQLNGFDLGIKTDSAAVIAYNGPVQNRWKAYYIKATWEVPPYEWQGATFQTNDVYIRSARIKYTVDQPLP
ncbi:MAG: hypothetical protein JSU61_07225 [Fidelibacterota bacterium]|nr:MAG: hypothetical protein JSU61_07225 [Candidatus Neomarinimicrobiota bacterium]